MFEKTDACNSLFKEVKDDLEFADLKVSLKKELCAGILLPREVLCIEKMLRK